MTKLAQSKTSDLSTAAGDRLESWKEIAVYLKRDVRTVQRWEQREGLPVHRQQHDKLGSVYAYRSEIEQWRVKQRRPVRITELCRSTLQPFSPYPRRHFLAGV